MAARVLPSACPSCGQILRARRLDCTECGTAVEGEFALPPLVRLSVDDQEFVIKFIKSGGALKEMARLYGVSYPTVRNRLDALIARISALQAEATGPTVTEEQEK